MFNGYFIQALDAHFRYFDKRMFYVWLYCGAVGRKVYQDFGNMYLMGGEL